MGIVKQILRFHRTVTVRSRTSYQIDYIKRKPAASDRERHTDYGAGRCVAVANREFTAPKPVTPEWKRVLLVHGAEI